MNSPEKMRVLLIEDNPGDTRLIREMLADIKGKSFDFYHSGRLGEALQILAEGKFDVILTDLNLPDSSGFGTFRKVHETVPKLPIIVLTGLSDEALGVQTVQEGAQDYLVKQEVTSSLLAKAVRYAIERNRLRNAHEELVNVITHELRTPLTVIGEIIEQLFDGLHGEISGSQIEVLQMGRENVSRMCRLINNLLDASRMENGQLVLKKETADIVELAKRVMLSLSPQVQGKATELRGDFLPEKIELSLDKDKILQVFTNLVGNAIKFTSRGTVTVSVRETESDVECIVSDTGVGLSEEDLPKVFGKFEQFHNALSGKQKGSGLGLYITRQIISLHGGDIRVESKPNEGSRFIFHLPK